MFRIIIAVIILAAFIGQYMLFMWLANRGEPGWFWGKSKGDHILGGGLAAVVTLGEVLGLAQPVAFLKYLFS
jgi:hypothetical protein